MLLSSRAVSTVLPGNWQAYMDNMAQVVGGGGGGLKPYLAPKEGEGVRGGGAVNNLPVNLLGGSPQVSP